MAKKTTTIVDQLHAAIRDSGETAYRISKETGVPEPTLSRFLSGQRDIRLQTAAAIAEHLGLQLVKAKN
jgi:DNA-binding phage protein